METKELAAPAVAAPVEYLGYHLRKANNVAFKPLDQALAKLQLTTAMFGVLHLLSSNAAVSQSELARYVGLHTSSMVPLLDKLESRDLVQRERQTSDRRTVCVSVTPEGKRLWTKGARIVAAHEQELRSKLTEDEIASLITLLDKLSHAPSSQSPARGRPSA